MGGAGPREPAAGEPAAGDPAAGDPAAGDVAAGARRAAGLVALVAGGLMHLVVGVFVSSSGLVAPLWAVVLLVAVWAALAVLLWRWHRRRPLATLAIPFVAAAVWWATITLGEQLLGWTA